MSLTELVNTLELEWGSKNATALYLPSQRHLGKDTDEWHLAISVFVKSLAEYQSDRFEIQYVSQHIFAIRAIWGFASEESAPAFERIGVSFLPSFAAHFGAVFDSDSMRVAFANSAVS